MVNYSNSTNSAYSTRPLKANYMFTEKPEHYGRNRLLAEKTYAKPATLADGSAGAVMHYGRSVIVLSENEAHKLIASLLEALSE